MSVTRMFAQGCVNDLVLAGYRLPDGATTHSLGAMWAKAMDGLEDQDLREATDEFIRTGGRYWPKPSEIRDLALTARRERGGFAKGSGSLASRYRAFETNNAEGSCPVCGARLQLLSPAQLGYPDAPKDTKRYGVYHDRKKHRDAGIPHVGPPYKTNDRGREGSGPRRMEA